MEEPAPGDVPHALVRLVFHVADLHRVHLEPTQGLALELEAHFEGGRLGGRVGAGDGRVQASRPVPLQLPNSPDGGARSLLDLLAEDVSREDAGQRAGGRKKIHEEGGCRSEAHLDGSHGAADVAGGRGGRQRNLDRDLITPHKTEREREGVLACCCLGPRGRS